MRPYYLFLNFPQNKKKYLSSYKRALATRNVIFPSFLPPFPRYLLREFTRFSRRVWKGLPSFKAEREKSFQIRRLFLLSRKKFSPPFPSLPSSLPPEYSSELTDGGGGRGKKWRDKTPKSEEEGQTFFSHFFGVLNSSDPASQQINNKLATKCDIMKKFIDSRFPYELRTGLLRILKKEEQQKKVEGKQEQALFKRSVAGFGTVLVIWQS